MDNTDPTVSSLEGMKSMNNDEKDPNKETVPSSHDEKGKSVTENPESSGVKKKRGRKKGKKIILDEVGLTRYSLRSSADGSRVQGSTSNGKDESQSPDQNPNNESVACGSSQQESVSGRKKRGRKPKIAKDLALTIRNRVRSLVTRMNYEQNLIDAYSTDGWKGQNLEKLRPEKEIERAKAEIIKCKLRIRDSFKELGLLAAQGKLDKFDAKGEIDCEDIFCAKCGLKTVTPNNDIILCDGICDRGFHQNCLNPPLLTKDIPSGDQDWLCTACDCKLDCVVLLNESKGSNLCLQDSYEKVFPEAAAAANGTSQFDQSDLPSDDSEDNDYNPDAVEEDDNGDDNGEDNGDEGYGEESDQEESSSDISDFYTDSDEDEKKITKKAKNEKKQIDIEALPSEDSEDDDFEPEGPNSEGEDSEKMSNSEDFTSDSDEFCNEIVKKSGGDEDVSTQPLNQGIDEGDTPVVGRRQRDPTDYEKLYRETFGKASSESSDDEDWSEERRKKGKGRDLSESSSSKQSRSSKKGRTLGLDKTKTLKEYFETSQYPNRRSKEILAEELALTYIQVTRWFETARHQARGTSAETSNGSRRRGRPTRNSPNKTVAIPPPLSPNSAVNAQNSLPASAGTTPNAAINVQKMPSESVRTTVPNSAVNAQKTPSESAKTTRNSALNAQKTPSARTIRNSAVNAQQMPESVTTSKGTTSLTEFEFLDSERKKAVMRELRKQKTGR